MPPRVIGPYQILSVLGSGGIGCVYRAMDQRNHEEVALKLLSSGPALDPIATRRMAREFEALADLSHPNVVRVFEAGVFQGYPFLTMELVEGLTLREYLMVDSDWHSGSLSSLSSSEHSSNGPHNARSVTFDDSSGDIQVDSCEALPPFDINNLGEELDSEAGPFFGEHVSGRGPEALRKLADAIDEPFTDEESSDEIGPWNRLESSETGGQPNQPPEPNLDRFNRPERIAMLKDALMQICDALAYVHARGMVHRDLKPSNIMVDDDRRVRLMDFGLAKFLAEDSAVTAVGHIVGTYRFMAPEQLLGEHLDARSDLYSLGIMLYELLAGRPAFDARTPLEMCQHILEHDPIPLLQINPNADEQLARLAHRLIHKDPAERYQTAEEVAEIIFE